MTTWSNDKVVAVFTETERGVLRRGRDDISAMLKRGEAAENWDGAASDLAAALLDADVRGMSAGRISQYRKAFRHFGIDVDAAVASIPDGESVTPTNVLASLPAKSRQTAGEVTVTRAPDDITDNGAHAAGDAASITLSLATVVEELPRRVSELTDAELNRLAVAIAHEVASRKATLKAA